MNKKKSTLNSFKIILLVCILFMSNSAFATTYYVDAISGNDDNSGTAETTAWKTLSKVGSTTFSAGDFIAFKRDQKFTGKIVIKSQGSLNNPIVFGAYGEGGKPIITDLKTSKLTWIKSDVNVWKCTNSPLKMQRLLRNGTEILKAYTSDELGLNVPDLIEWYHNGSTLYLYSNTDPNTDNFTYSQSYAVIQTIDRDNLTFQDITVEGGNVAAINCVSGSNISFLRLNLGYMSYTGIEFESKSVPSENIIIDGCTIDAHWGINYFEGGNGFYTWRGTREGIFFNGNFNDAIIKNNILKNWHHSAINIWANPTNPNYVNNMKILNNYITSPDIPYGGKLSFAGNSRFSEIAYNTFENMYGARMQMDGNDNHVHHNTFINMRDARIKSGEGGAMRLGNWNSRSNYNHIIEYNVFKNCYSSAIDIGGTNHPYDVHDITFRNNIFDNDTSVGEYSSYFYIRSGDHTKNIKIINNNIISDSTTKTIVYATAAANYQYSTTEFENADTLNGEMGSGNYSNSTYTLITGHSGELHIAEDPIVTEDPVVTEDTIGPFIMSRTGLR